MLQQFLFYPNNVKLAIFRHHSKFKDTIIALKSLKTLKNINNINLVIVGYTYVAKKGETNLLSWYRERYIRKVYSYIDMEELMNKVNFVGIRSDMQ